jgi:4-aminobutyrate aminotransferase-like enzyme
MTAVQESATASWLAGDDAPSLDVLESAELWTRAGEVGRELLGRLCEAGRGNAAVVEVRGVGLMIGVELVNGDVASRVQREGLGTFLAALEKVAS